jgi:glycine cleavage system H protein
MSVADLSTYRFSASHEWVKVIDGGALVGISEHAQSQLGDVIFLELPEAGATLTAGDKFGVVESVKAASDLYAPVGGTVEAVNDKLGANPELVNTDPYGEGWMIRLRDVQEGGVELMDSAAYERTTAG